LRYRLVGGIKTGLKLSKHPSLAGAGKAFGWWLYDEIDLAKRGRRPTVAHSILFTGGHEVRVTFTTVTASHVRFFLPQGLLDMEDQFDALELLTA
jgi:hypothetical protein